jgi:dTDP-4-dehydrorhamnose reductase
MEKILVTGGNGQLGNCLKKLEEQYSDYEFLFTSSSELDITNEGSVKKSSKIFSHNIVSTLLHIQLLTLPKLKKKKHMQLMPMV